MYRDLLFETFLPVLLFKVLPLDKHALCCLFQISDFGKAFVSKYIVLSLQIIFLMNLETYLYNNISFLFNGACMCTSW